MRLNASARIMYDEAKARGYEVERFEDKHLLRVSDGRRWYFLRGSRSSKQSSVGMTIADYKGLTRQVLERAGIPMAEGGFFSKVEAGLGWAREKGFPLVFKPGASRHGKGVVVGVADEEELIGLVEKEGAEHGFVLERVLQGDDFRVVVVDYKFVAASKRLPAFVDGDGKRSIAELVEQENRNPERGVGHQKNLTRIVVDELVKRYLRDQGRSLDDIPARGERVFLRKTAGLSTGGVGIDVTDEVGEENKALFERISREADLRTVGIDVMAGDLLTPLQNQEKAGVLELNASPGLRMHHFPYKGKPRNVAGAILEMLFGRES